MNESVYPMWNELKNELKKQLSRPDLIQEWLSLEPKNPLSMDGPSMKSVLLRFDKSKSHNKS